MGRAYLKIYFDWDKATETLSSAEKGRLIDALVLYARCGKTDELPGAERHVFPSFQAQIDRDIDSYAVSVENGKLGGAPIGNSNARKQPKSREINLNQPKTRQNNQDKDKDKYKDKEQKKKTPAVSKETRTAFRPPTLQEVEAYCKERGNGVDAKRFYDYYSEADWKDREGNPVRNWKQKMIAVWERKDTKQERKGEKDAPVERDYTTAPDGMRLIL